ncbi:MAG: hypothetical protein K6A98_05345 [Prevotella sp.]|nr:hypothetical protein [Prevotella sp.]
MEKKISKAVWLSFDLGIGGDYPGLYKWLDNHDAIECGDSVAFFKYILDVALEADLVSIVKKDIEAHVKLRAGDRLYIIRREVTANSCSVKGDFITGKRKGSPWEGYGDSDSSSSESGE